MTAQAVTPPSLPADRAPVPPAAPDSGGGSHFFAVFGGKSATPPQSAAAPNNPPTANASAATRLAPLRKVPGATDQGDDRTQSATAGASNGSDAATAAIALTLPLLVQLQQTPTPVIPAAADGTTPAVAALPAGLANRLPLPARPPGAVAGNVALLTTPATGALATSLPLTAAAPSLPAATAAAATQAPASTPLAQGAAAILSAAPGPSPTLAATPSAAASIAAPAAAPTDPQSSNPPLASTLNARLASGAAVLVSQPRVALASLAPASDKAAAKPPASDGGLPTNSRQLAAQGAHDTEDAPAVPTTHTSEQPLTSAKDNLASSLASSAAHEPDTREPTLPPLDNGTLNTVSPPPATAVVANVPAPNEAPTTLPIIPHAVAEQVAINVHQAVKSGTDHIQIQLQPADLGTIDVKLNVNHDGRVTVVVTADRGDTLNLLQQDAGGLTQALRDAGLQADNSSLSFNLRGGFQFQQQQSAGSGGGSRDGAYLSDGDGSDVIAAPLPSLRRHAGALDIHV
jgi:flagellar hook-length control protein FliK